MTLDISHQLCYNSCMVTIRKITDNIYFIEQYGGRMHGSDVQRVLLEEYGVEFPVEDWSIRVTTTSIGKEHVSSALIERKGED